MVVKFKVIVVILGVLFLDKKLVFDLQMDCMFNILVLCFMWGMVCDEKNVLFEEGGGGLYVYLVMNSGDYFEIRFVI